MEKYPSPAEGTRLESEKVMQVARGFESPFLRQNDKNKKHVLFAPNIKEKTRQAYAENDIEIKTTSNELTKYIKENNK